MSKCDEAAKDSGDWKPYKLRMTVEVCVDNEKGVLRKCRTPSGTIFIISDNEFKKYCKPI